MSKNLEYRLVLSDGAKKLRVGIKEEDRKSSELIVVGYFDSNGLKEVIKNLQLHLGEVEESERQARFNRIESLNKKREELLNSIQNIDKEIEDIKNIDLPKLATDDSQKKFYRRDERYYELRKESVNHPERREGEAWLDNIYPAEFLNYARLFKTARLGDKAYNNRNDEFGLQPLFISIEEFNELKTL